MQDVIVSPHALERIRARYDPGATAEQLAALALESTPAPHWVRKWVERSEKHRPGRWAAVAGPLVLILDRERDGRLVVVTVTNLNRYRDRVKQRNRWGTFAALVMFTDRP